MVHLCRAIVATMCRHQPRSTGAPYRPLDSMGLRPYRPPMPTPDSSAPPESILIVDFGSQVTQLIARRVREAGVYSEIVPFNSAAEAFARMQPRGVILSGGPASVTDDGSPRAPQAILDSGLPILAICYGQQTLCVQLGGTVEGGHAAEFGRADVEILKASPLFDGFWEA